VNSKKVKRKAKQVNGWGCATRFHEPSSNLVKQDNSLLLGANAGVHLNCCVLKVLTSECRGEATLQRGRAKTPSKNYKNNKID